MSDVIVRPHALDEFPEILLIERPSDPGLTPATGARLLLELEVIRRAEEWLLEHEELVHGPVHSSIGQEAVAVGTMAALREGDMITSTHRAHHHVLSKTLSHYAGPDYDPLSDPVPEAVQRCVIRTIAEILGLADGWAGGRGGSMHLIDLESGVAGTTAIVGGGIPIASGLAYAGRLADPVRVAVAFLGDGAASIGAFHEGISMARVWGLPAIFVVENNLYSVATTVEETVGFTDIVLRAAGQDMLGLVVDGMDTLAMREAVRQARSHAAAGNGPVLIEAKTYRYRHQNGKLPGSAYRYRTKDEEAEWGARDPLAALARDLDEGILTSAQIEQVRALAADLVAAAGDWCTVEREGVRAIRPERQPSPTDAERRRPRGSLRVLGR